MYSEPQLARWDIKIVGLRADVDPVQRYGKLGP